MEFQGRTCNSLRISTEPYKGSTLQDLERIVVFLEKQHRQRTDEDQRDAGAPIEQIYEITDALGFERGLAEQAYEKLRRQGEVYEPTSGTVKAT